MSDTFITLPDVGTLYTSTLATPLTALLAKTQELQTRLAALPDDERQKIKAAINTPERTAKEAFVAPDTLAALPALHHAVKALNSFCQKKAGTIENTPLTSAEIAAGSLRWEPFDQFTQSVAALAPALETHKDAQTLAQQILTECEKVQNAISPREYDRLFLAAVNAQIPSDETAQLAHSIESAKKAATELLPQLGHPENAPDVMALKEAYAKQCTLSADQPVWSHTIRDALAEVERLALPSAETSPEALQTMWNTLNQLRTPTRALNALLLATNTPVQDGTMKNDAMLALTSQITAQCWTAQCAIGKLIEQRKAPPTTVTGATGEQVSPPEPKRDIA